MRTRKEIETYLNSIDYLLFQQKVLSTAGKLHESVNHFYGEHHYEFHLRHTSNIVNSGLLFVPEIEEFEINILTVAAAFHDAIEDTRSSYNDILNLSATFLEGNAFDARTAADIVFALTSNKGKTRKEREDESYYRGIIETPYASIVKVGDRLANISFSKDNGDEKLFKMYKKELDFFLSHFSSEIKWPFSVPDYLINLLKSFK